MRGSDREVRMILSKVKAVRDLAFSLWWCLYGFKKKKLSGAPLAHPVKSL